MRCFEKVSDIRSYHFPPIFVGFLNMFPFPARVLRLMPWRNIWTPNKAKDRRRPHFTSLKKAWKQLVCQFSRNKAKLHRAASAARRMSSAAVDLFVRGESAAITRARQKWETPKIGLHFFLKWSQLPTSLNHISETTPRGKF